MAQNSVCARIGELLSAQDVMSHWSTEEHIVVRGATDDGPISSATFDDEDSSVTVRLCKFQGSGMDRCRSSGCGSAVRDPTALGLFLCPTHQFDLVDRLNRMAPGITVGSLSASECAGYVKLAPVFRLLGRMKCDNGEQRRFFQRRPGVPVYPICLADSASSFGDWKSFSFVIGLYWAGSGIILSAKCYCTCTNALSMVSQHCPLPARG
jgi:hypothetical protein